MRVERTSTSFDSTPLPTQPLLMEDVKAHLADKVQDLSDLELAALTCLIAGEHCIVYAPKESLNAAADELQTAWPPKATTYFSTNAVQIASNTFGLSCAISECDEKTTVDDFGLGLLVDDEDEGDDGAFKGLPRFTWAKDLRSQQDHGVRNHNQQVYGSHSERRKIANVAVVKNLNIASQHVQIQALELIRGKRIFTRTAFHTAPKRFLFIALLPIEDEFRLISQLNDHMFISHSHLGDEEADLDVLPDSSRLGNASESSIIRSSSIIPGTDRSASRGSSVHAPVITKLDIDYLINATSSVRLDSEVRSYLHNVVIFLRTHRAVGGGVSALATRHLLSLAHVLAPLHSLNYVTPSLVALAAKKIYPHRVVITTAENERSTMWGSSAGMVAEFLDGLAVEDVIDDVLASVETPL